ncbi:sodium:proton antiporter [Candidatus Marinamargulisbacteria bacterium SCGC AG-414-C22]|nr:sodium:proton antiporter [Candidatus Marinamargulisbacteria bacterium SCGC AG-414-C22]
MVKSIKNVVKLCSEYSLPLIIGVFVALLFANVFPHTYHDIVHHEFIHGAYWSTLHFFVNDIFMVFFFGIATVEIVESFLKGGALNPIKKAINPLFATVGGVVIPVLVFFLLTNLWGVTDLNRGWGIPTATDIALAWLAAKLIFGASHPAINFLLLLAIVDDAIGLGIIAIFYGDPSHPANPVQLLFVAGAMLLGFIMRKRGVQSWPLYIFGPGLLSWYGLYSAHLHPALALVFVVPFLPSGDHDDHEYHEHSSDKEETSHSHDNPLVNYLHSTSLFVDFGLFFFAFANAGVQFSSMGTITWVIFASLIVGKTIGIFGLSYLGKLLGFPLPNGMGLKELLITGMIAGIGLTVALFVAGVAYTDGLIDAQGPAKMGALLSGLGFLFAWLLAKLLGVKPLAKK